MPLATIGVAGGLLLFRQPFGFMALLGFMSLSGMLIKNSIVLIEEIDRQIEEGKDRYQAILDSGTSRMRPVLMAALTVGAIASDHWRGPGWHRILDVTYLLTPRGNHMALWHPDPAHLVPGLVILPALGLLYFATGHLVFARRDL